MLVAKSATFRALALTGAGNRGAIMKKARSSVAASGQVLQGFAAEEATNT